MKATTTSWPTRGRKLAPHFFPAQGCATRIQHELLSSPSPRRSQWNWTLMRPYSSVWISSPEGPTTIAVWRPRITGFGVTRAGRNVEVAGMQVNVLAYSADAASP